MLKKGYVSIDHIRDCVAYLDKYVLRIEGPEDIKGF